MVALKWKRIVELISFALELENSEAHMQISSGVTEVRKECNVEGKCSILTDSIFSEQLTILLIDFRKPEFI